MPANIIHIQETDSTNNYLKQLLQEQRFEEGMIVSASFQTAGKGQRGNSWESDKDENLLFSMLLYPHFIKANQQFLISQTITLGIARFLSKYTNGITIKWPNDIYWLEKKICGILIENFLEEDNIKYAVCGIGININQSTFRSGAPNPVSLKQITGQEYPLDVLLEEVQESILSYYRMLQNRELSFIAQEYKASLFRREGFHLFNDGTTDFCARIKDIEPSGILVLECENGKERRFAFKEIKYK